jgi:hypothetical protein
LKDSELFDLQVKVEKKVWLENEEEEKGKEESKKKVEPAFPTKPEEALSLFAPKFENVLKELQVNRKGTQDFNILGSTALIVIITQLDRLASSTLPVDAVEAEKKLAVLGKPFAISVNARTLELLAQLILMTSKGYFSASGCNDSVYSLQMYLLLALLRVLRAHLFQLVKAKLPLSDFKISDDTVESLRNQIMNFLRKAPELRTNCMLFVCSFLDLHSLINFSSLQLFLLFQVLLQPPFKLRLPLCSPLVSISSTPTSLIRFAALLFVFSLVVFDVHPVSCFISDDLLGQPS